MTTAKVEIWRDCGFTEGCLECPSKTSSLSNPDYTFTGLNISRETLFSQFKVKKAYEDLYDCSYVRMTMDMNNGDDVVLYGWVDRATCGSDTANNPMTMIDWHVDYWRTYLSKASFGSGTVTRRPESGTVPPQTGYSNMTQLKSGSFANIIPASDYFWVFMNLTVTKNENKVTTTYCWPVTNAKRNKTISIKNSSGTVMGVAPSFNQSIMGYLDEALGIDPDAIYGCWLSPIPPKYCSYTTSDPYIYAKMDGWAVRTNTSDQTYAVYTYESTTTGTDEIYDQYSVLCSGGTTDIKTTVVTDFDRNVAYSLPWGVTIAKCRYRLVNCDTSMYIAMRFSGNNANEDASETNGLACTIPLKSLAMSSNAKSSYVYSGQQEYDREQMQIQRNQALVNGITSSMTGTAGNVTMASLGSSKSERIDNFGTPNARSVSTAKTGGMSMGTAALLTMGAGIAGASIDYVAQGAFNDAIMDNTMKYKAQQTSTLTLPGSGWDWIEYGIMPSLVDLTWDDYSVEQRQNDIDLYGITVSEPMTSCQSLINAGGPLRIQNLTVTGQMPVGAKQFFRDRFAKGVRIV